MRTLFFLTIVLFLIITPVAAQNYYVAAVKGVVYYQNKPLKKKDKVTLKGDFRFKTKDSYVQLSGPGGLYKFTADMGRASGSEFLLALSDDLLPKLSIKTTAPPPPPPSADPRILMIWNFWGQNYTFLDQTALHIDPAFTAKGQMIFFLYKDEQGLTYQKATIRQDSILVLQAANFPPNNDRSSYTTYIVQLSDPRLIDTLVAEYQHIKYVPNLSPFNTKDVAPGNQILDYLNGGKVIHKPTFMNDMRSLIQSNQYKTQNEFLNDARTMDYLNKNYGEVYQLKELLSELGLPK